MKRRILTIALAGALALSLAACGGGSSNPGGSSNGGSSANGSGQPGGSASDVSAPDVSTPDGSVPDASNPDSSGGTASGSAGGSASSAAGLQPLPAEDGKVTITLNRTYIELNKAGATFRLRYTATPDTDGIPSFTSSDAKVATVDETGTVTAVAPGKATITVKYDGAVETCSVTCKWTEQAPAPSGSSGSAGGSASSSGGSSSSGGGSSSSDSSQVDLQKFYNDIAGTDDAAGKYQFVSMMEADDATLTNLFAGLSDLSLSQQVVYLCGMMPSPNGDFVLVQVSDAKDVDTVKSIFQARIDYMVGDGNGPGGAWYPMEQTMWEEYARIAVNGNYVMLIAHDNCDDIVKEFNALF